MSKLTKKEITWLNKLQRVLDECPSPDKIGFYTTGDSVVYLYDLYRDTEVAHAIYSGKASDWCIAVQNLGAGFNETINFPSPVGSTAG